MAYTLWNVNLDELKKYQPNTHQHDLILPDIPVADGNMISPLQIYWESRTWTPRVVYVWSAVIGDLSHMRNEVQWIYNISWQLYLYRRRNGLLDVRYDLPILDLGHGAFLKHEPHGKSSVEAAFDRLITWSAIGSGVQIILDSHRESPAPPSRQLSLVHRYQGFEMTRSFMRFTGKTPEAHQERHEQLYAELDERLRWVGDHVREACRLIGVDQSIIESIEHRDTESLRYPLVKVDYYRS